MTRRLHTPRLFVGRIPLDPAQAKHARRVLRLANGAPVELFDDRGVTATGSLVFVDDHETAVIVEHLSDPESGSIPPIIVASAVPKGERADWMVEKLSELGVAAFVPLAAERSVVLPEGKGKPDRWIRIATESAKQSRRSGVMRIDPLIRVDELLANPRRGLVLSTESDATPILEALDSSAPAEELLLIGPEGGWTDAELAAFRESRIRSVRLTNTILRIETAAIAAAALLLIHYANPKRN